MLYRVLLLILFLSPAWPADNATAHGSVAVDDDLCVIEIGYFRAHFKIYQPEEEGHKQYCEDVPRGDSEVTFVMEHSHGDLGAVPVDFRIIRNTTGMGRYARWSDVEALGDLEPLTVFYQPPVRSPDVFMVRHDFERYGEYLGIVTAEHPETGETYRAVFPFEVGHTDLGYLPIFLLLVALVQGAYWLGRGR